MINPTRERIPMPEQPKNLRCTNFDEVALGYAPLEAVGEAMRCLDCREQPCVAGCPIHQNIPGFLARVRWGTLTGPMTWSPSTAACPASAAGCAPRSSSARRTAPTP